MRTAFIALVTVFTVDAVGLYFGWYLDYFWFDMTLHFLGGLFIAMLMADYLKEYVSTGSKLKNALIVLGVTAFVGVVWEFAEYVANQTLTEPVYKYFKVRVYFIGDLDDTINDLAMDILGAAAFYFLHLLRRGKSH